MNWRIIIAICLAFFVNKNVSFEGCSLPEAGYAWEYNSTMDLISADVKSSEICGDLCLKNETCQGYSWEKGGTVILVKKNLLHLKNVSNVLNVIIQNVCVLCNVCLERSLKRLE